MPINKNSYKRITPKQEKYIGYLVGRTGNSSRRYVENYLEGQKLNNLNRDEARHVIGGLLGMLKRNR